MFFPPCHFSWLRNIINKPTGTVNSVTLVIMIKLFMKNVNNYFIALFLFGNTVKIGNGYLTIPTISVLFQHFS